ncbi:hypothetical protein ACVW0Y_003272 [Pseudomonas sp. TE3786]
MSTAIPTKTTVKAWSSSPAVALGSRIVAAIFAGYGLAYASTMFLTVYLPLVRSDRVVFASLASFIVYVAAVVYTFAARSASRAWLVLLGLSLLLALGALVAGDFGARR